MYPEESKCQKKGISFQVPTHIQQMSKEMDQKKFASSPESLKLIIYIAIPLDKVPNKQRKFSFPISSLKRKMSLLKEV